MLLKLFPLLIETELIDPYCQHVNPAALRTLNIQPIQAWWWWTGGLCLVCSDSNASQDCAIFEFY